LNYFIYKKDQSFFTRVVKPYLINKKEKTYIDLWLIDSGMAEFLEPQEFNKLNIFEKIILAERLPSAATSIARYFADLGDTQPPNAPLFNQLFAAAIKGSALDTDDQYDLRAAQAAEEAKRDEEYEEEKQKEMADDFDRDYRGDSYGGGGGGRGMALASAVAIEMDMDIAYEPPPPAAEAYSAPAPPMMSKKADYCSQLISYYVYMCWH